MKQVDLPRIAVWTAIGVAAAWIVSGLSVGDLSTVALLSMCAVVACMIGLGELVARGIGPLPSWVPPVSARLVTGVAVWAIAQVALTLVLPDPVAFWAVTLIGAAGVLAGVWRARVHFVRNRGERGPSSWRAELDALTIVMIARAATMFTDWIEVRGTAASLLRHYDLVYHLAAVKELMFRGAPATGNTAFAGFPKGAYHPTFDTFAAQLMSGTRVPVDSSFFRFVLPFVTLVFLVSIGLMAAMLAQRWEASPLAIVVTLGPFALWWYLIPDLLKVGALGRNAAMFFMNNPPAAMALPLLASSVLCVAIARRGRPTTNLAFAAVFAMAVLATKANAAIAFVPAFGAVVAVGVWQKWWPLRSAVYSAVAAFIAFPVAMVLTAGQGQPMAIQWGAFVAYLEMQAKGSLTLPLLQGLAAKLAGHGPIADVAYLLAYALLDTAILAIPALVVWVAVFAGERLAPAPAELLEEASPCDQGRTSWPVAVLLGLFAGTSLIVCLLLVQRVPVVGVWNIANHTLANLLWIPALFLAAGLARLMFRRTSTGALAAVILAALLAVALALGQVGFATVYGVWWQRTNRQFYTLATRLERTTPRDAVVAQDYQLNDVQWVSGFGGRRTPLERADWVRLAVPGEVARRERLLAKMYAPGGSPAVALQAARELGVDFAIVDTSSRPAILSVGRVADRVGRWVLVDVRSAEASQSAP
jgi:hypothetical protein